MPVWAGYPAHTGGSPAFPWNRRGAEQQAGRHTQRQAAAWLEAARPGAERAGVATGGLA
ncbi:hypothetical protein [Acetonema longum]|uniref:Uncharacterized protein n=1 Tax=Acetonema longum DSM 6540 TaxID=1009370 RepID=F7NQA9_9FIRM|nr:hypothetical protein [Acetonema longum]EGO61774.1 hypothetical protein ALO_21556 [Acetonema longum DSM 6540]